MSIVRSIATGFFLSLAFASLSAFIFVGRPALLRHAAKVKPYSVAFLSPPGPASRGAHGESSLIVFFGDSSVAQPAWAARHSPRITALLRAELRESFPELGETLVADWSFAGGRLFHYYCLLFEAERHSPALVVIPINWRSLGPQSEQWRRKFAFPELSGLVPPGERAHQPGNSILQTEGISAERQRFYRLQHPLLYVSGFKMWLRAAGGMDREWTPSAEMMELLPAGELLMGRYTDERLFEQYANEIPRSDPPMQALRSVVAAAERRRVKLLFYITPIHLEEMRRREVFDEALFQESVGRVVAAASSEMSLCLDLSGLLRERDFIDNFEHYTTEGNRLIARALAKKAGEILRAGDGVNRTYLSPRAVPGDMRYFVSLP